MSRTRPHHRVLLHHPTSARTQLRLLRYSPPAPPPSPLHPIATQALSPAHPYGVFIYRAPGCTPGFPPRRHTGARTRQRPLRYFSLAPSPLHRKVSHRSHVGARPGLHIRRMYLQFTWLHHSVRLFRSTATGARTHRRSLRYYLLGPSLLHLGHPLRRPAGARPTSPDTYIYIHICR